MLYSISLYLACKRKLCIRPFVHGTLTLQLNIRRYSLRNRVICYCKILHKNEETTNNYMMETKNCKR